MQSLPFERLGFSSLFCDFAAGRNVILSFFPRPALFDAAFFAQKAASNPRREAILEAVCAAMQDCAMSERQRQNLDALAQPTTLTVVTGQQIGFLGGPLYTALKAYSCVQAAENFSRAYNAGLRFVPIFWIEDNDHDRDEISSVALLNAQGEVCEARSAWSSPTDRISASELRYEETILADVDAAIAHLSNSAHSSEIAQALRAAYRPQDSPTKAFTSIVHATLGESGILFVSAAELRKRGLFAGTVERELQNVGASEASVIAATKRLAEAGYSPQMQSSPVNLFLHAGGKRHKIRLIGDGRDRLQAGEMIYGLEELRNLASNEPDKFSPSVALRPIAQDDIFPNAAYVGGPGEITYLAQIQDLYALFGVSPVQTLARHSATLIDKRSAQTLKKLGVEPIFFLRRYDEAERELVERAENPALHAAIETVKSAIEQSYAALAPHIAALDPTLAPSVDKARHRALQGVQDLEGKARKAQKRAEETIFAKARRVGATLFPSGGLQERALPYSYFAAQTGIAALNERIAELVRQAPTAHYLVHLEGE
jgi:bacillithiol biosynthesis cysteine-adding enzyme BshC